LAKRWPTFTAGKWSNAARERTPREIWDALIAAGANPRRVDGVVVTVAIEDRRLLGELDDVLMARELRKV